MSSKKVLLILTALWLVLAYRVGTLVFGAANEDQVFVFQLTLLAWLGGLVTTELARALLSEFNSKE